MCVMLAGYVPAVGFYKLSPAGCMRNKDSCMVRILVTLAADPGFEHSDKVQFIISELSCVTHV